MAGKYTRKAKRSTGARTKKSFFKKSRSGGNVKPLTKAIIKVVNRRLQTKYVAQYLQTPNYVLGLTGTICGPAFQAFSSAITGTAEIYGCIPKTVQGDDDHQRVGDYISPVKLQVRFDLSHKDQENNQSIDKTAHVFCLSAKAVKDISDTGSIPITELLDSGDGTNAGFDGTKANAQFPINKKSFTVHSYRKIRLCKPFGRPNGTTGTNAMGTDSVLTVPQGYKRLTVNVPLPKTLTYDTKNATYPNNSAPFICIGYTTNDATGPASNVIDLQVLASCHMWYKDG